MIADAETLDAPEADSDGLRSYLMRLHQVDPVKVNGKVTQVIGLVIESIGPNCSLGDVCVIKSKEGEDVVLSEVVGFRDNRVLSMILGEATRVGPGSEIIATNRALSVNVGEELLGRVLDGLGRPLDAKGPLVTRKSDRFTVRRRTPSNAREFRSLWEPAFARSTPC